MTKTPDGIELIEPRNHTGTTSLAARNAPNAWHNALHRGTAGVKVGPRSISFGPAAFAMRGLPQSLARDLGPKGIHVAWINVDGSIDIPEARGLKPSLKDDDDFLKPDAIAETYGISRIRTHRLDTRSRLASVQGKILIAAARIASVCCSLRTTHFPCGGGP